ncbi:MAG TPA: nitrate/nitrite transporter NrtS [Ktedonobacterales bacterium]|jgi:hypothetical protein|nr:nitrate/nitrite transporter NrtS [Ktedonobacterales bacterium]
MELDGVAAKPIWRRLTFVAYCLERDTLVHSLKAALVVGTVLALINHGQQLLSGRFAPEWVIPMLLTYLVPFSVATYGQIQGKRQRDRAQADGTTPAQPR